MAVCVEKALCGCVLASLLVPSAVAARPPEPPQSATFRVINQSLALTAATNSARSLMMVFRTSGSRPGFPYNGEFRPSATREGMHEASYDLFDADHSSTALESGTIYIRTPVYDVDEDAVPDFLEIERSADVLAPVEVVPTRIRRGALRLTMPAGAVQFTRSRNKDSGKAVFEIIPGTRLTATQSVVRMSGELRYRRTESGSFFVVSLNNGATNGSGSTRVTDVNTVKLSARRLRVAPNKAIRMLPTVLERVGKSYIGTTLLSDGFPGTPVADFRSALVVVSDPNDLNANGVANFSDALPPFIVAQPQRQYVSIGDTVTLSVTVEGAGPFTFKWQHNGHEVNNPGADASARVLVLTSVSNGDRGSYRVMITGPGGSIWSDSTSVSFK
jgi:hypothetical protein